MSMDDMGVLLDTFAAQPLDFYGALRAATYDGQIRAWIRDDVVGGDLADEDANMAELSRRLINRCAQGVERSKAATQGACLPPHNREPRRRARHCMRGRQLVSHVGQQGISESDHCTEFPRPSVCGMGPGPGVMQEQGLSACRPKALPLSATHMQRLLR